MKQSPTTKSSPWIIVVGLLVVGAIIFYGWYFHTATWDITPQSRLTITASAVPRHSFSNNKHNNAAIPLPQEASAEASTHTELEKVFSGNSDTTPPFANPQAAHLATPPQVKALYMSSWVAGSPSHRNRVLGLVEAKEINSLIIDIKDATGMISYEPEDPELHAIGGFEKRISDVRGLIEDLHSRDIYVIGRLTVFQDPYLSKAWPEQAVKSAASGGVWQDRKGLGWMDPASQEVWDYVTKIARDAYSVGFDEINLDYVRFPSDGNISDMVFDHRGDRSRTQVMKEFFTHIDNELRQTDSIPLSADVFGMTTSNTDDLGIGQVFEDIIMHVDFIAPMVYPSHYPAGFSGYAKPASVPGDIINIALSRAVERTVALGIDPNRIRPWIQDFDLGAVYTAEMVRDQIEASYAVGLHSWMVWDPSNRYTPNAYLGPEATLDWVESILEEDLLEAVPPEV